MDLRWSLKFSGLALFHRAAPKTWNVPSGNIPMSTRKATTKGTSCLAEIKNTNEEEMTAYQFHKAQLIRIAKIKNIFDELNRI